MYKLLDLFCGGGGAAVGYSYCDAEFDITGIDINPQPRYPFRFARGDALDYLLAHGNEYDAIHSSPPCQAHSNMTHRGKGKSAHRDYIAPLRELLVASGKPYVIENVVGAPLREPVMLCGSSFRLRVRRHRLFESNFPVPTKECEHAWQDGSRIFTMYQHYRWYQSGIVSVYGSGGRKGCEHWNEAMGINWMTRKEIVEAIPPAYTEYVGRALLKYLNAKENANGQAAIR